MRGRQSEGRVEVLVEANRRPVNDRPRMCGGVGGLLARRAESAVDTGERHYPVAATHESLEVDLKGLPALADPLKEPPDSLAAAEVAPVRQIRRRVPLDVLVEHRQH